MSKQSSKSKRRAGLLWFLLSKKARRRIAAELTLSELKELNDAFAEYRKSPPAERRGVEREALHLADYKHGTLPTLLFFCGIAVFVAVLAWHVRFVPDMGSYVRYQIFWPLFMGAVSPLTCYFLPAYRLRNLFNMDIDVQSAAITFLSLLGLVWTLFFVGLTQEGPRYSPVGVTLWILCLGAATAPFLEEVGFRELLPGMIGRAPHYAGHGISALLFAAVHIPSSVEMFVLYTIAGLFLATVRLQTEGLLYPFIVHVLANLTILLL